MCKGGVEPDKMRAYEKSHPWINFTLDLRKFDYKLWMALGEAVSKCEHLATVPLQPETAGKLQSLYLAKGIRATAAIEGNTLSEEEVIDRLAGKRKLPPSREYLGQEIDNILDGCNLIIDELLAGGTSDITISEIKQFNKIVFNNLSHATEIVPGKIRSHRVGVASYRAAPPEDCEFLLEKMCGWINGLSIADKANDNDNDNDNAHDNVVLIGILKTILAHLYIAWIHPFGDGNGRTASLVELKILLASRIPVPAVHLLSNHYNLTRTEYYRQLDYSSKSNGDVVPFIRYAVEGFIDGLKTQIEEIRKQHLFVGWENYIYTQFKDRTGEINDRRKFLILDLTNHEEPVPLIKIREISPRIAEMYAGKTLRTIRRDVEELSRMGLIIGKMGGLTANNDVMLSFLPGRVEDNKAKKRKSN